MGQALIPVCTPENTLGLLAAEVLHVRLLECAEALGSLDQSSAVEVVHRARLATRQLRTAIETFGEPVPLRHRGRAVRRLGSLYRALGRVRDLDIAIAQLGRTGKRSRKRLNKRRGVHSLRKRLSRKRTRLLAQAQPVLSPRVLAELEIDLTQARAGSFLPDATGGQPAACSLRYCSQRRSSDSVLLERSTNQAENSSVVTTSVDMPVPLPQLRQDEADTGLAWRHRRK